EDRLRRHVDAVSGTELGDDFGSDLPLLTGHVEGAGGERLLAGVLHAAHRNTDRSGVAVARVAGTWLSCRFGVGVDAVNTVDDGAVALDEHMVVLAIQRTGLVRAGGPVDDDAGERP